MGISKVVIFLFLLVFFLSKDVSSATITFLNKCGFTVWPGVLGNPPLDTTGFQLQTGGYRSLQAPAGWSGRFWGRTGCNSDGSDKFSCSTGDCESGQVECNGSGANPPATLAEFTLGSGSPDYYDVSLVDGFNLPMMVDATGSGNCGSTGCEMDINKWCPTELQSENGQACKSACGAFGTPEYCCSGTYSSPSACVPSVYAHMFKASCPKSYSYAFDDSSSTFTCVNGDYTITFCTDSTSEVAKKTWNSTNMNARERISSEWTWIVNHIIRDASAVHSCSLLRVTIFVVITFIVAFDIRN